MKSRIADVLVENLKEMNTKSMADFKFSRFHDILAAIAFLVCLSPFQTYDAYFPCWVYVFWVNYHLKV